MLRQGGTKNQKEDGFGQSDNKDDNYEDDANDDTSEDNASLDTRKKKKIPKELDIEQSMELDKIPVHYQM
ncbi:4538_t:CDS:2 [Paraglomus brasilianum]|uniref:4538_t:CDS:1 n=1 Tax=Paraglomus brasilianum TaxID=144538 RepID=A0A9N8VKS2_9GLOM|nr:4538_t:CDS:2 [Paraglomus brasilianum]